MTAAAVPTPTGLLRATTPQDADAAAGRGTLLCGGTDLLVERRAGRRDPLLVDLSGLPGPAVQHRDDVLVIAATAPLSAVRAALGPGPLSAAIDEFASATIRNRATLGGNLATGSPAADTVPALVVSGARLLLRRAGGHREIGVEQFLLGPRRVDLREGEWIAEITVARDTPGDEGGMRKVAGRRAQAISLVSLAWRWRRDGDRLTGVRLAMGAVAPTVVRLTAAEALLQGSALTPSLVAAAAAAVDDAISPIDDLRAGAAYRRRAAAGLLTEVLTAAAAGPRDDPPARPAHHRGATPA